MCCGVRVRRTPCACPGRQRSGRRRVRARGRVGDRDALQSGRLAARDAPAPSAARRSGRRSRGHGQLVARRVAGRARGLRARRYGGDRGGRSRHAEGAVKPGVFAPPAGDAAHAGFTMRGRDVQQSRRLRRARRRLRARAPPHGRRAYTGLALPAWGTPSALRHRRRRFETLATDWAIAPSCIFGRRRSARHAQRGVRVQRAAQRVPRASRRRSADIAAWRICSACRRPTRCCLPRTRTRTCRATPPASGRIRGRT